LKLLALIPARGGSKGIPGKNIKSLGGLPLIGYTIQAALREAAISSLLVSTEDPEIAAAAGELGAAVPFLRPAELAGDKTPTLPVIQDVLSRLQEMGQSFDAVCLLQATSPFRLPGLIGDAIQRFRESGADSLVSVRQVPAEFNPHWVFEPGPEGFLRLSTGEDELIPRRQDLPPAYYRDGSVYLTRSSVIMEQNSLYGKKIAWLENKSPWFVNLDTLEDWHEAENQVQAYQDFLKQHPAG
jgi:CMP-N,N'-diacetyllegionaminic acid synthase